MTLRLVDLFSGCGGISLGFMAAGGWRRVKPVLALDNDSAAVRVYNKNLGALAGHSQIAIESDISEFIHPAEIQAFYLEHLSEVESDNLLRGKLEAIGLSGLRNSLLSLDVAYYSRLRQHFSDSGFKKHYSQLPEGDKKTFLLARFLARFRIPRFGAPPMALPKRVWSAALPPAAEVPQVSRKEWSARTDLSDPSARMLTARWRADVAGIVSAHPRLGAFLASQSGEDLRKLQVGWLSARRKLRLAFWSGRRVATALSTLYAGKRANLVVGGPPCQGFSRPGRAKLGSLKGKGYLAFVDDEFGDERNKLYQHYLLFLSALNPDAFLFENVNTFKSKVTTARRGALNLEERLQRDVESLCAESGGYAVASRVIDAADLGVPQRRRRYFLLGCSRSLSRATEVAKIFEGLKPKSERVRSLVAFSGLGEAAWEGMENRVRINGPDPLDGLPELESAFAGWLRRGVGGRILRHTDGHVARKPSPDDAQLFRSMKPGQCWKELPDLERLLRGINPRHHLLREKYLRKGPSNHGDWLAKLDDQSVARTICAHLSKDGYAYVHPSKARTISVREAARLQSFPDWFSFSSVQMGQSFRMIGNAVPPLMGKEIAEQLVLKIVGLGREAAVPPPPANPSQG